MSFNALLAREKAQADAAAATAVQQKSGPETAKTPPEAKKPG